MRFRFFILLTLATSLVACVDKTAKSTLPFELSERGYLYEKKVWSFTGRLAFSDSNDSFSASIDWKHQENQDELELSGPFGQGRTLVQLTGNSVVVDYGNKRIQSFGDVDSMVSKHTGINIPVSALKYWVLGLVEPDSEYVEVENGFLQSGWQIEYQQINPVSLFYLPQKIRIEQNNVKLKLIINEWDIQD